jgi:hypothetical protein
MLNLTFLQEKKSKIETAELEEEQTHLKVNRKIDGNWKNPFTLNENEKKWKRGNIDKNNIDRGHCCWINFDTIRDQFTSTSC